MLVRFGVVLGALLVFVHAPAAAQSNQRVVVDVVHDGDDVVGGRLAFAVRERVASSPLVRLYNGSTDAAATVITLSLVTLEPETQRTGAWSTYSAVWTLHDYDDLGVIEVFITSSVGSVGASRVAEVADRLVAATWQNSTAPIPGLDTVTSAMRAYFQAEYQRRNIAPPQQASPVPASQPPAMKRQRNRSTDR